MKRIFLLALVLGAGCLGLNAQTSWSATSLDGNTYRNGNVGIGTDNPYSKLDINGDIQISNASIPMGLMTEVGGVTPLLNLSINFREPNMNTDYSGAGFRIDMRNNYPLYSWIYRTAASEEANRLMSLTREGTLILNSGNLGIGTSIPTERLEIKGNFKAIGDEYIGYFKSENDGWSEITIENQSGTNNSPVKAHIKVEDGQVEIGSRTLHAVHIGAGDNNSHMVINTEGNIGIGTTTPTNKLEVTGTIRAEEIKVETGWADFVFEENYNLRPLHEVHTYIQQNGHLPEIPTAKEVEENGVSLGEMNAKLLQKIEELTLYTIEQEKRIEELEKQNARID